MELLEKSIEIYGIGPANAKTLFNIEREEDKKLPNYRSLDKISGRKLLVDFKVKNGEVTESKKVQLQIPRELTEQQVHDFILEKLREEIS